MDYKILFIDEESTQHDLFMDYFEQVCPEITPKCEFPLATVQEMMQRIEEICPDAIVTDFRLNEIRIDIHYNVKYDGIELIKAIREQREDYPCFVVTSHDDEAVNGSDDVNMVYIKDILRPESNNAKVTFAARITRQIEKYRSRIGNARQELSVLIEKRNTGIANIHDEERIIELDSFLEKSLDSYDSIPQQLKKLSNLDRLNTLINKVDNLLKKLE